MNNKSERIGFYGGKFLIFHMGHLATLIKASCMVDKLFVVLFHSEKRDRELFRKSGMPYIPFEVRMGWISKAIKDMENVFVFDVEDFDGDDDYNWEYGSHEVIKGIGQVPDVIFSSEISYSDIFKRNYPGALHIIIDGNREDFNISATILRTDGVYKHWNMIPDVVKPYFTKKVMIVGTESAGKSTLVRNLAKYFNTSYVEEYGRTMCEEFNGCDKVLTVDVYPYIAYGHKMLEWEKVKTANKVLFIDTEAIITQYYSRLYTNKSQAVLDEISKLENYDLWLFLEPDVAWVDDGLRIHGEYEIRYKNNNTLKKMLKNRGIKYTSISGDYLDRFNIAIKETKKLLR